MLLSWLYPFLLEDRRQQSLEILAQNQPPCSVGNLRAQDFAELRSEASPPGIAPKDDPLRPQFAHSHLRYPGSGVEPGQINGHIFATANGRNAALPIRPRMAADQRDGRMPPRQLGQFHWRR